MSDSGFGKFVPGFDFLQGLAKQATQGVSGAIPQMPNLSHWVAPTLNVEELDKRIEELKAVQFWLDQNAMALKATIQALEVQKMTLATLKGMNFSMGDVANAFKIKATDTVMGGLHKAASMTSPEAASPEAAKPEPLADIASPKKTQSKKKKPEAATPAPGLIDPTAWWGALTQQFQHIAANALKDVSQHTAAGATKGMAEGLTKGAMAAATGMAGAMGTAVKDVMKPASKKTTSAKSTTRATRSVSKPSSKRH